MTTPPPTPTVTTTVSRYVVVVDVEAESGRHRVAVDHQEGRWRCVTCARGRSCRYLDAARAAAAEAGMDPTAVVTP